MLTVGTFAAAWWYVVVYNAPEAVAAKAAALAPAAPITARGAARAHGPSAPRLPRRRSRRSSARRATPGPRLRQATGARGAGEPPSAASRYQDRGAAGGDVLAPLVDRGRRRGEDPRALLRLVLGAGRAATLVLLYYFWRMDGEQLQILKELIASVVPLGVLTAIVLAVILFGITTATESAGIGALGALYLAVMARSRDRSGGGAWWARCWGSRLAGARGSPCVDAGRGVHRRRPSGHGDSRPVGSPDFAGARRTSRSRHSSPPRRRRWCAGCSSARRSSPRCSHCTGAKG